MLADLKMPGALEAVDGILSDADGGTISAAEAIEQLLNAQIVLRNNRRLQTAMRSSRLPAVKTLDQFDFAFQPSIKREQIESLHELGFLDRGENVILLGPPGVGKTHLAISLAIAAAEAARRVYYGTLAALIESLTEAKAARQSDPAAAARAHPSGPAGGRRDRLPAGQPGRRRALLPAHQRPAREGVDCADVEQGFRGLGWRARRRGHGGGSHRPSCAPLPHRQHPGQQLPDEGSSEPAPVRFGSTQEKSRRVIAGSNGDRSGDTRPLWITGLSRQTLGGRCANTVTYSSTKSDTPNTASGGTTARSK